AKSAGIKKVLVPFGQSIIENENETIDIIELGIQEGIEVKEVSYLNEALFEFTGFKFDEVEGELEIDPEYIQTMKSVATNLCDRSHELKEVILDEDIELDEFLENILQQGNDLLRKGKLGLESERFYTAASFCFGSNVKYQTLIKDIETKTDEEVKKDLANLESALNLFNKNIENIPVKTISDLQAYMIVTERLLEADRLLEESKENPSFTGFLIERINSAKSWSTFLGQPGAEFDLDTAAMKNSCAGKLNEVNERIRHLELIFPVYATDLKDNFDNAYDYYKQEKYTLCLFKASKTGAEVNLFWSLIGVREQDVDNIILKKLEAAEKSIINQINKGIFPILAYSYYEYAIDLREDDPNSALIYSQYALELSNIDLYFKTVEEARIEKALSRENIPTTITNDSVNSMTNSITGFAILNGLTNIPRCTIISVVLLIIGIIIGFLFCCFTKKRTIHPKKADSWRRTNIKLKD
ncbi:hypothetical protein HN814_11020, partial [Candidatus Woesearchaeota archaeon]|nr:hypothetical protein [Candidatus Woesearchaeota archaeon]